MRKAISIVLSVLSLFCVTCNNAMAISPQRKSYKIGHTVIRVIDKNKLKAQREKRGRKMIEYGSPGDTLVYYSSTDYKILAIKHEMAFSTRSLKDRYSQMQMLFRMERLEYKNLSTDSITVGENWVYVIEHKMYTDKLGQEIYFFLESNTFQLIIRADADQRESVLAFIDAITQEILNVKLHLK